MFDEFVIEMRRRAQCFSLRRRIASCQEDIDVIAQERANGLKAQHYLLNEMTRASIDLAVLERGGRAVWLPATLVLVAVALVGLIATLFIAAVIENPRMGGMAAVSMVSFGVMFVRWVRRMGR